VIGTSAIAPADQALARAVHDLNGPLTVIRGLCATLAGGEERAERRRALALIDAEVMRLARGLAGLVREGRDDPPASPEGGADLAALVRSAAERFAAVGVGDQIAIRVLGTGRAAPVAGDAGRIERALDNLLRNAVRHAGARGTVVVRVAVVGGRAEVLVRDGGRGVLPQEREAIFLPGVRGAGARGEGRGLGLAIAREIAEECGGTLTLDPAGPGACFRLRLPLAPALHDSPRAA
jgi:two-component system sensor histidine kinase TctE